MREGPPPWQPLDGGAALARSEAALRVALAPTQRDAIALAIRSRVLVITGGPGTGKTTLVRGILAAVAEDGLRVALAAPTGRAARRLAESTAARRARCTGCSRPTPSVASGATAAARSRRSW